MVSTRLELALFYQFLNSRRSFAPNARLKTAKIGLYLGHRFGVVFLDRHLEQLAGVTEPRPELVEADHDLLELRPLLAKRLGALGLVPHIGLFEFALNFGQALCLAIVVKGTSSTHRCVRRGRRWSA